MENLKIIEDLGTIRVTPRGSEKKLIKAEWFGKAPVYEIRDFGKDGEPMKRSGMSYEEIKALKRILNEHEEI